MRRKRLRGVLLILCPVLLSCATDSRSTVPESFTTAPASFGKPSSIASFSPYTVYVYDHDIANDLG